jgi:predicted nucleic acid-binding protein
MRIGVDACFLIALYDRRDSLNEIATSYFADFFNEATRHSLVLPWPVLYESISTRFARRHHSHSGLRDHLHFLQRRNRLIFADDQAFRDTALSESLSSDMGTPVYRSLSMVDRVIRLMILEETLHMEAFITFNERDFADVCGRRGVRLIGRSRNTNA